MDNAPDSGPAKKPTPRSTATTAGVAKKPATARKPAARKPAAGAAAKTTAAPASGVAPAVETPITPETPIASAETTSPAIVAKAKPAAARTRAAVAKTPATAAKAPAASKTPAAAPAAKATAKIPAKTQGKAPAKPPVRRPAAAAAVVEPTSEISAEPAAPAEQAVVVNEAAEQADAQQADAQQADVQTGPTIFESQGDSDRSSQASELFPQKSRASRRTGNETVLRVTGLTKRFDDTVAVDGIDLTVKVGSFYGIVGPNGAGKTTTLSMITGLLRPDSGTIIVHGSDVWSDTIVAKRNMGVLPDRLRLFDRLTGAQLLYYAGVLRGLDGSVARERTADLAHAFGLEEALGRLVSDYSAGMTKKIALAAAMIHSPRLLVLDEPFESVDPVSSATVTDILKNYVAAGGTVVLSSHSMDLVQRICDHVAVVVHGRILADGTMDAVRDGQTLEERFVQLAGGRTTVEGLEWLHTFSD